jgi:hypothetical protein
MGLKLATFSSSFCSNVILSLNIVFSLYLNFIHHFQFKTPACFSSFAHQYLISNILYTFFHLSGHCILPTLFLIDTCNHTQQIINSVKEKTLMNFTHTILSRLVKYLPYNEFSINICLLYQFHLLNIIIYIPLTVVWIWNGPWRLKHWKLGLQLVDSWWFSPSSHQLRGDCTMTALTSLVGFSVMNNWMGFRR